MGQDFAQEREWDYKRGLDWYLCDDAGHREVLECYRALLHLYKERPVLHNDCGGPVTCEWINSGDVNRNIFTFIRRNPWNYNNALIFVCNFAPVERWEFGVGAPVDGIYKRVFTTYPDGNPLEIEAKEELCDGRRYKLTFTLRPFESVIFEVPYKEETEEEQKTEKAVKQRIKREHDEAKNDLSHVPQVPEYGAAKRVSKAKTPKKTVAETAQKTTAKKPAAKKSVATTAGKKTAAKTVKK